jgi:hypothetical protein
MALVKFSRGKNIVPGKSEESIKVLNDNIQNLKRELEYILNNLDKQNFSEPFIKKNSIQ